MYLAIFIFLFPLLIALILATLNNNRIRRLLIWSAAIFLGLSSIMLLVFNVHRQVQYLDIRSSIIDRAMFAIEIIMGGYLLYLGLRFRRYSILILAALQVIIIFFLKSSMALSFDVVHDIFIDRLSIVMSLIICIAGGLVSVYSVGYMDDYHAKNPQFKDKRSFFFFTTFLFISAMLGLVFSNNLIWLYFFWEITTLCSFLLIGYNQTEEARHNAFKALEFNLLGGLSLVIAITYLYFTKTTIELDRLMVMDKVAVMLPVALISFAGIIKSAQFPFSGWLVGAMVAPTPVSALLHSSTMVEAGVYLILRFALILDKTMVGYAVALIGGLSFLLASLIALTQSNSKKVLAYSTVANLGLVLLCAGIGTFEAVWAAVLLIIFHALIKGLLFLCVGVFEDKLQSRDIEDMSGLIITMPKLSVVFQIGMAGMFLAPFGMLISKWAVIKAIVDYNPALSVFVVFGSAATILLWVKWLGRLIIVIEPAPRAKEKICNGTWLPLYLLSGITVVLIALFPYISEILIDPYIMEIYKKTIEMGHDNIVIMSIMLALLILFPISFIKHEKRVKVTSAYLGGANIKEGTGFYGAMGETKQLEMRNYYFDKYFNEQGLLKVGRKVSLVLIFIMFAAALL